MSIGNITAIGFGVRKSWKRYWTTHSQFWGKGRSGLTMPDDKGNNIAILPSCGNITANSYALCTTANFGSGDSSGYIEVRFYYDGVAETKRIFESCDQATTTHIIRLLIGSTGKLYWNVTHVADNRVYQANTGLSVGWHTCRITSTGSAYSFTVDGGAWAGAATTGLNDGKWFNLVDARDNITIGAEKTTSVSTSGNFIIDYLTYNGNVLGTKTWYFTGKALYEYTVATVTGYTFTWVGAGSHIAYSTGGGTYLLDAGYSIYSKALFADEYVPYGGIVAGIVSDGYALKRTYAGSSSYHNLAPSLLRFSATGLSVFDKSNSTYHIATGSMTYYDALNTYDWEVNEIANPITCQSYFNVGYKGMAFGKIVTTESLTALSVTRLDEIIALDADQTGNGMSKIEAEFDIDIWWVYASATYTVDANNYLVLSASKTYSSGDYRLFAGKNFTNNSKVILYAHSNNGDEDEPVTSANLLTTMQAFFDEGWAVISSLGAGNNWGNQDGLDDYNALIAWAKTKYNFTDLNIWAQSMGGCCGLHLFMTDTQFIKFIGMLNVCSLLDMFTEGTYKAGIKTAYGFSDDADYATATAGYDPMLLSTALLTDRKMELVASPDDVTVVKVNNADAFNTLAGAIADITMVTTAGIHSANTHYDPVRDVAFLKS